jgi:CheY-like chemotaxis protein
MSSTHYCNRCLSANPAGQLHCGSCGVRLIDLHGTRTHQSGAIWIDAPPKEQDTLPPPLEVTLRDIDKLPPVAPPPARLTVTEAPELVGHPDDKPVSPPGAALRAERRAAVRRALLRAQQAASDTPIDVLLYDPDDEARARIAVWLSAFGFTLHSVPTVAEALVVASERRLAAVFVDVTFDDSDGGAGVELCKRVKAMSRRRGDARPTLLVLVSRRLAPVQQVAAQLAGCDECLVKPVTRGAVAGVLDKHCVKMPLDSRRL